MVTFCYRDKFKVKKYCIGNIFLMQQKISFTA